MRMTSTTMTVRLSVDVKERLQKLAAATRRSRSFLAAEAVEAYVDRETAIVEGIEAGLADMRAGRVIGHDEAMAQIGQTIAAAEKCRA
jgi:predicted transcriptional regulator